MTRPVSTRSWAGKTPVSGGDRAGGEQVGSIWRPPRCRERRPALSFYGGVDGRGDGRQGVATAEVGQDPTQAVCPSLFHTACTRSSPCSRPCSRANTRSCDALINSQKPGESGQPPKSKADEPSIGFQAGDDELVLARKARHAPAAGGGSNGGSGPSGQPIQVAKARGLAPDALASVKRLKADLDTLHVGSSNCRDFDVLLGALAAVRSTAPNLLSHSPLSCAGTGTSLTLAFTFTDPLGARVEARDRRGQGWGD